MRYKVITCDIGTTQKELDGLDVTQKLISCNYIGSLKNQLVIERTVIKLDEAKTVGRINSGGRKSNSKNKK